MTFIGDKPMEDRDHAKSSWPHLNELGYTRITLVTTISSNGILYFFYKPKLIFKSYLSPDCRLQLAYMKMESLVIADQHAAVNSLMNLVHTARHILEVRSI